MNDALAARIARTARINAKKEAERKLARQARKSEAEANRSAAESAKLDGIFARAQRHAAAIDAEAVQSSLDHARRAAVQNDLDEDKRVYFRYLGQALTTRIIASN